MIRGIKMMIRGTFGKLILTALMVAMTGAGLIVPPKVSAAADPVPKWQLIEPAYPTADTFVAAYSVKDFGASGDGVTDVTEIFQELLDSLGRLGGGTLFVPQGRYVLRGTLIVPKGVTLRGEWSKPIKGEVVKGTILMAYAGRGTRKARLSSRWSRRRPFAISSSGIPSSFPTASPRTLRRSFSANPIISAMNFATQRTSP
jgi:hypothetical protein